MKITVLGAGNMGTAIAQIAAKGKHDVRLWDYNPETIKAIKQSRENVGFLPGIKLFPNVKPEADMAKAVADANIIIMAVASPYLRKVTAALAKVIKGNPVIGHIVKGLEEGTFLTMYEVMQSELSSKHRSKIVTITGLSIAKEFAAGIPTAVIASSMNRQARELVRKALTSDTFNVGTSTDFKGAGMVSALKNVYAIAHGMCDGLKYTMNAKAFLLSMAIKEMEIITVAYGGRRETVYGINGLGDLIVTCLGDGRNRALGERICRENTCKFIFAEKSPQTYEGVAAAKSVWQFLKKKKLRAPIAEMVYGVVHKGKEPCKIIKKFFKNVKLNYKS